MATLGASMVTLLTDNWAGAGAAPTFGFLIDYRKELADTTEQVLVRLPIHEDVDPINDILSNFKFTMQLRVKTTVSEDRLKVLTDETIRIINTYAITGITRQFAKRGENTSDRKMQVFSYDVWATLEEHASTAGTSYSSPGAGDVVFPAEVTINAVHVLSEALMLGSANAEWVPCSYTGYSGGTEKFRVDSSSASLENVDGTNGDLRFDLNLPTTKGSLKLYVTGTRVLVQDADAQAYVNATTLYGFIHSGVTSLNADPTNYDSQDVWDDTFGAVDCSSYNGVFAWLACVVDAQDELNIHGVQVQCYYAA